MVGTRRSGRIAATEAGKATHEDQVVNTEKRAVKRRTPKATAKKSVADEKHATPKTSKRKVKEEEPAESDSGEEEDVETRPKRPRRTASRLKKYAEKNDDDDDDDESSVESISSTEFQLEKEAVSSDASDADMEVEEEEEEEEEEERPSKQRRPASAASSRCKKSYGSLRGKAKKSVVNHRPCSSASGFEHTPVPWARPNPPGPIESVFKQRTHPSSNRERKEHVFRSVALQLAKGRVSEMTTDESESVVAMLKRQYHNKIGWGKTDTSAQMEQKADAEVNSSSSEDEWEEMEGLDDDNADKKDDKKITVTVCGRAPVKDPWAGYMRQEVNRFIKASMENAHKCHVLCYIAHLQHAVRSVTQNDLIPALILSQMPADYSSAAGQPLTMDHVDKIVKWFASAYKASSSVCKEAGEYDDLSTARLAALVKNKQYDTDRDRALMLLACLLSLGASARLVCNCRVMERRWDDITPRRSVDIVVVEEEEEEKGGGSDKRAPSKGKGKGKKEKPKNEKVGNKGKDDRNYWCEYWSVAEQRWICVDPVSAVVDGPVDVEAGASSPMLYVLAVDNECGVRDVSCRYAAAYLTPAFRKLRVEADWMNDTLGSKCVRADASRCRREDASLRAELLARPMPTALADYKNHPLYALEKDCLKFEAIYPRDEGVLGEVRKNKVYPRSAVHTLQSAKNWIKQARSVKEDEKPYKVVKGRPDFRKPAEERCEKWLDVFGLWQTEPYRRPECQNGRIPVNEFGNVYMYRDGMCPIGGVYLRLPNLHIIARKLRKPFAAALVGWNFHGMSNHPVLDGGIVLEEDEGAFRAAWQEMEKTKTEKERQKRDARVHEAWRRLIRGALQHEYVKKQFAPATEKNKQGKEKLPKKGKRQEVDTAVETLDDMPEKEEKKEKSDGEGEGEKVNWPESRYTLASLHQNEQ